MKRLGFTLIELVIALAITGIIGGLLWNSLSLAQRGLLFIEQLVHLDQRSSLIAHQMGKDLQGAFVPLQAIPQEKKATPPTPIPSGIPGKPQAAQPSSTNNETTTESTAQDKPLEKIFIGTLKDTDHFDELSFITSNSLQIRGEAQPRITRVTYTLKPSIEYPKAFQLMRAENSSLPYAPKENNARSFIIADNIKSCTLTYVKAQEVKKQNNSDSPTQSPAQSATQSATQSKKDPAQQSPSQPQAQKTENTPKSIDLTLNEHTVWPTKENTQGNQEAFPSEQRNKKPQPPALPNYVIIRLSLWTDRLNKDFEEYEFRYQLYPSLPIVTRLAQQPKNEGS